MPSDSPRLREVKTLLGQLSKPLEKSFADTELRSEMLRELRFQAMAPSAVALKDRPQLTKARAIDQEKVMAFQEAREAWDTKKLKNAARQQKPRSTPPSSTATLVTHPRSGRKEVHISAKVMIDLISPDASFSESGQDIAAENSPVEEEKEEDYIDIEDILASLSPINSRKTGGSLKNKPPVVSRSGRVIKVVDKEKI